jgi:hypothetical protein
MTTLDTHVGQTLKIGDIEIIFFGHRGSVLHIGVKAEVEPVLLPKPPREAK